MSLAADALSAMKDLQNVKTGQMFIGASQTTGVYILPRLIRERLHSATWNMPPTTMLLRWVTFWQSSLRQCIVHHAI